MNPHAVIEWETKPQHGVSQRWRLVRVEPERFTLERRSSDALGGDRWEAHDLTYTHTEISIHEILRRLVDR